MAVMVVAIKFSEWKVIRQSVNSGSPFPLRFSSIVSFFCILISYPTLIFPFSLDDILCS